MKPAQLLPAVLGVLVLALGVQGRRTAEEVESLRTRLQAAGPIASAPQRPRPEADEPASTAPLTAPPRADELAAAQARIATLERDLDSVVESLNALVDRLDREAAATARASQPSWGVGKATGEPDTMTAGDHATAWAPAQQDGGPEWLQLGYEKAVEVAQVRVRETCGAGCIEKVAAVLENGAEVVIWQGRHSAGTGIVDAAFSAPAGLLAHRVKIYLDTKRVAGWNEIDAVELIGRDGTRQWAKTASASSSFGDRSLNLNFTGRQPAAGR